MQGGGECVTADECLKRFGSPASSSKLFPPAVNFSYDPAYWSALGVRKAAAHAHMAPSIVPEQRQLDKRLSRPVHPWFHRPGRQKNARHTRRDLNAPVGTDELSPSEWGRFGWWMLDDQRATNPDLWGWNHVLLPYCSQDLWGGQRWKETVQPRNRLLPEY